MKRKGDSSPEAEEVIIQIPTKGRLTIAKRRKMVTTYNSTPEEKVLKKLRRIPLASENFSSIIEREMIYVDKTDIIHNLLEEESHAMFIARPRKFGKSLVVDIITHILQGHKELFEGLKIYKQRTNWERYAVVRLNFAFIPNISKATLEAVKRVAQEFEILDEVPPDSNNLEDVLVYFQNVRTAIFKRGFKVAILVDEYDLPIVQYLDDNVKKDNYQNIEENSQLLHKLFNHIKNDLTSSISYFIVTGVAKFSKTGLFSAANQLQDISMNEKIATLYGYTRSDLETYFKDHLIALARKKNTSCEHLLNDLIKYYNGYCFSFESSETVLNPYDINKLLSNQSTTFESYWTNTGIIDLVVVETTFVWIIEIKVDKNAGVGLQQIEIRKYYEKYMNLEKQVEYMEIIIDKSVRNVDTLNCVTLQQNESLNIENVSLYQDQEGIIVTSQRY